MSLVTWLPPTGTASAKTKLPPKNTPIVVVPPPMSMTVTPRSISSSTRQARPGGIGADDERLDFEMRAADRGAVVAHARGGGGHDVHVDAEPLADHAARVADAAAVVDREADRDRMDDLPVGRIAHRVAAFEHLAHVAVGDLAPPDADFRLDDARGGKPARQVGDGPLDRLAGHFLGGVHGVADRVAGGIEVDDRRAASARARSDGRCRECAARSSTRAMKQQIFVVPISIAAIKLPRGRIGAMPVTGAWVRAVAAPLPVALPATLPGTALLLMCSSPADASSSPAQP